MRYRLTLEQRITIESWIGVYVSPTEERRHVSEVQGNYIYAQRVKTGLVLDSYQGNTEPPKTGRIALSIL